MNTMQLHNKWAELSNLPVSSGFRSVIISAECISEIFIGLNSEMNRCLILALPTTFKVDVRNVVIENLSLTYYEEDNIIVLQLTNNNFYDLFDDLIVSMYHKISGLSSPQDYSKEFIQTFFKWSEFFDDRLSNSLTYDIVKGLFGELLVLKSLVQECQFGSINEILSSWKGPYDQGHDFVLGLKNIEVKTKSITSPDITISSEFQLESDFGKELELWVVDVQDDSDAGVSISDLILSIKGIVAANLGDTSILFAALQQKGLSSRNLIDYDIHKFLPVREAIYNCCADAFPKIIRSKLPDELNGIKYNIRMSSLTQFIIFQRDF